VTGPELYEILGLENPFQKRENNDTDTDTDADTGMGIESGKDHGTGDIGGTNTTPAPAT
jgi:hypothetical protein